MFSTSLLFWQIITWKMFSTSLLFWQIITWKMLPKHYSIDQLSYGKWSTRIALWTNYPMENVSHASLPWPIIHVDVVRWKHFPRYWPFVRGINWSSVEIHSQRPETWSFDVFFDLLLNKLLSKQSRRRSFEMPSCPLWRHCDAQEKCFPFISALTSYHMENVSHKLLLWPIITRKMFPIHIFFDQLWQGNELMYSLEGDLASDFGFINQMPSH